jgi:phospholipase/carboxylesterase
VGLHGWGANAQDLAGLAPYMNLSNCQLLFPDAPLPHPQVPGGRMWYGFPAGYDFRTMPNFEQQSDVQNSRRQLQDWLRSLPKQTGIPLMQTILAGFSQGGAMTLDVGLHLPLAGLVVMSGYLHAPLSLSANAPTPPVFMVHGRFDPVVPLAAAHQARDALVEAGVVVDYAEYDMGHEIQPAALAQIRSFVQGIGAKTDETT